MTKCRWELSGIVVGRHTDGDFYLLLVVYENEGNTNGGTLSVLDSTEHCFCLCLALATTATAPAHRYCRAQ